jgi:hypothetical protein
MIKLTSAAEVDAEMLSWLTESYDLNTD